MFQKSGQINARAINVELCSLWRIRLVILMMLYSPQAKGDFELRMNYAMKLQFLHSSIEIQIIDVYIIIFVARPSRGSLWATTPNSDG